MRASLNRLGEKPNPSGSGWLDEYSRYHLVPVLIDASSILLDSNPLGGVRRAQSGKGSGGIFSGSEDFLDLTAQQRR
jgi:hypothetical protein